jgi:hypothetical protein
LEKQKPSRSANIDQEEHRNTKTCNCFSSRVPDVLTHPKYKGKIPIYEKTNIKSITIEGSSILKKLNLSNLSKQKTTSGNEKNDMRNNKSSIQKPPTYTLQNRLMRNIQRR